MIYGITIITGLVIAFIIGRWRGEVQFADRICRVAIRDKEAFAAMLILLSKMGEKHESEYQGNQLGK